MRSRLVWMPMVLTAVLGPGVGQLYNRDYKKGAVLMIAALVVFVLLAVGIVKAAMAGLPDDVSGLADTAMIQDMVDSQKAALNNKSFFFYQAVLLGLWGYSLVDAYRVGRRRASEPPPPTTNVQGDKHP